MNIEQRLQQFLKENEWNINKLKGSDVFYCIEDNFDFKSVQVEIDNLKALVKTLQEQVNKEREEATEWFIDFNNVVAEKRKLQDKINAVLDLIEPSNEISHQLYRKVYEILK